MEAFSDGVIAILITIMVLDLKVPHDVSVDALLPLTPVFLSYVLSFVFLAIYWNNHHHLLQAMKYVNAQVLWANAHLLFWLSLIPFATAWMGENGFAPWPVALYGAVLFCAGVAFSILVRALLTLHSRESNLAPLLQRDVRSSISLICDAAAVPLAFVNSWASGLLYALVSLMWLVPNRRIEQMLNR